MTVSIKGKGPKKRKLGATRWTLLREKFITLKISGVHVTLEEFAKAEGVPLATLKERSAKEKWFDLADQRANQLLALHAEHAAEVRNGLRERLMFDEVEVRARLADNGLKLESVGLAAIARLMEKVNGNPAKNIAPQPELLDKITPSDAAFIMRIGQELQRKALGLPDKLIEVDINHKLTPAEERFRQQIGNRGKVAAALTDISKIFEGEVVGKSISKQPA